MEEDSLCLWKKDNCISVSTRLKVNCDISPTSPRLEAIRRHRRRKNKKRGEEKTVAAPLKSPCFIKYSPVTGGKVAGYQEVI